MKPFSNFVLVVVMSNKINVHLVELRGTSELYAMKAMEKSVMMNRNKPFTAVLSSTALKRAFYGGFKLNRPKKRFATVDKPPPIKIKRSALKERECAGTLGLMIVDKPPPPKIKKKHFLQNFFTLPDFEARIEDLILDYESYYPDLVIVFERNLSL
ncbi:hypothetical protein RYX36_021744, partial [Vicia faba]